MENSPGEFEPAEEGSWISTPADQMPGMEEGDSNEPVPDMGEEVDEGQNIPTGEPELVDPSVTNEAADAVLDSVD